MKITTILLVLSLLMLPLLTTKVDAAESDTVSATVTAQYLSISVSDGSVSYGTIPLSPASGSTVSTLDLDPLDTQTVTNDSNIVADLNIKGTDSTAWTLATTAGANQYVHRYSINAGSSYTPLSSSTYSTLKENTAPSGTQTFDLQITTPTSTSSTTAQSVDVVVQVSLPD